MTNPTPGVQHAMQCSTADSESCSSRGAGHELLPLQGRVAAATPSRWRDAIVTHVTAGGWLGLAIVGRSDAQLGQVAVASETAWVWNHAGFASSVSVGEPVALHELYNTLALGSERVNVLVAAL